MLPPRAIALLEPNLILRGCILELLPEVLQQQGLKGLVLDVDDTLVSTRTARVSPDVKVWMEGIRQVAQVVLVSNNLNRIRIHRIAKELNTPYLFGAGKPSRKKVRQAVQQMNLPFHEVGMVGDRLFTDVIVGNRLGMFTVLVEPMWHGTRQGTPHKCIRQFEIWLSHRLGATVKL
jgi:uncharacterized protein